MAKQIDANTFPCLKSEMDLFSLPPIQVSVEKGFLSVHYTENPVTNAGPYRITVSNDALMMDLFRNYLYVKLRIVKADGTALTDDDVNKFAAISWAGKTLFQRVIVKLGDVEIYNSGPLHAYQAYLETWLNYRWEAKNTHLQSYMYHKDTAGKFTNLTAFASRPRTEPFMHGGGVILMGVLICDLFKQDRYMISDSKLSLELHRNEDNFCLVTDGTAYKILVEDVRWWVLKLRTH